MFIISVSSSFVFIIPNSLKTCKHTKNCKYEYDVLMNKVSEGQGILIGDYPNLKRGKRYSFNDIIIKKISVKHAHFDTDNIIIYSPYKEVRSKKESDNRHR